MERQECANSSNWFVWMNRCVPSCHLSFVIFRWMFRNIECIEMNMQIALDKKILNYLAFYFVTKYVLQFCICKLFLFM